MLRFFQKTCRVDYLSYRSLTSGQHLEANIVPGFEMCFFVLFFFAKTFFPLVSYPYCINNLTQNVIQYVPMFPFSPVFLQSVYIYCTVYLYLNAAECLRTSSS